MSLRTTSEILENVFIARIRFKREVGIGETVALHLCLAVYAVSTMWISVGLFRLATASQYSSVSLAVDRYGQRIIEESDTDFGHIRLPDYPIE